VSPDEPAENKAFIEKFKLPYPLLSDSSKKTMTAYGAFGKKMMYGKEVIGVIRSSVWIGPDGVVKKHWKKIADASKHPEQALAVLNA
jgi:thioredoxin-dependent peroxiredoxin